MCVMGCVWCVLCIVIRMCCDVSDELYIVCGFVYAVLCVCCNVCGVLYVKCCV